MSSLDLALLRFIFNSKVLQQQSVSRSWAYFQSNFPASVFCLQDKITDLREKAKNSTAADGHADFTEKPRVDLRARRFAPCELRDSDVTNSECGWLYIPANSDCGWEKIYGEILQVDSVR